MSAGEYTSIEREADARAADIAAQLLRTRRRPWLLVVSYRIAKWCARKAREWRLDA